MYCFIWIPEVVEVDFAFSGCPFPGLCFDLASAAMRGYGLEGYLRASAGLDCWQ
jgi:hypothetical protein